MKPIQCTFDYFSIQLRKATQISVRKPEKLKAMFISFVPLFNCIYYTIICNLFIYSHFIIDFFFLLLLGG